MDAREAADGQGKVAVGTGIILGPKREALMPVAVEAPGIAVVGAGRIHQAREGPFGFFLEVGGGFEVEVFDAGVLAEGTLEGEERAHQADAAS